MPLIGIERLQVEVDALERDLEALAHFFPRPRLAALDGKVIGFRHRQEGKNVLLLSYLKCVRSVSTLNACLVLLARGFSQEVGALCRGLDEFSEDVMFLMQPLGDDGTPSKDQARMVEEFYQEEFSNVADPVASSQSRDRVPRRNIYAALARTVDEDPARVRASQTTLMRALSGFVHGAYVHIMELYGGSPPKFHLQGMLNTPRNEEMVEMLRNCVYRTMGAVEIVAARCTGDDSDLYKALRERRSSFFNEIKAN